MRNRNRDGFAYDPPLPGQLAARHTLLAEIYMGWQMMTLGYSGQADGDGTGILHQVLARIGIDDIWGYSFIAVGTFMLQCALIEFLWGRRWNDYAIWRLAAARRLCALCAVFLWMIALYLQVTTALNIFKSLALMVPLHLVMAFYFFYETTRVHFFIGTWHAGHRAR